MKINLYKHTNNSYLTKKNVIDKKETNNRDINNTLKGVLKNNHVKNNSESEYSFSEIQNSLLMYSSPAKYVVNNKKGEDRVSAFDEKNALKPLLIGTGLILAGMFGLTCVLNKSSKTLLKAKNFEQLPDLAINMNIKEEPHFAIYRAIRDPNLKNMLGAVGVFLMSGITLVAKNFVDGAKEIWLKKQSADIEKSLQEDLIQVETESFSGKLKVVNDLLNKNLNYFDSVLNSQQQNKDKASPIFSSFISFKGQEKKQEENKKNSNNIKYLAMIVGVVTGAIAIGKFSFSNLKKIAKNSEQYATKYVEKTVNAIEDLVKKSDKNDIPIITELMKSICAKTTYIREVGQKYNLSESEIQNIIDAVDESRKTIFADAPTALGGIPKKVQYYCYIDENRGHLYNWILNPENKFTKYIFASFTLSSAVGYLFKQGMDAVKEVTVMKENAKTELDLRKRLVSVEVENFKSKKESAIIPLVDNFTKQANSGEKTKHELKQLADNILFETKNGPPYIYN